MNTSNFFDACLHRSINNNLCEEAERRLEESLMQKMDSIIAFCKAFPQALQLAIQLVNNLSPGERDNLVQFAAAKFRVSQDLQEGIVPDKVKEKVKGALDYLSVKLQTTRFFATTHPKFVFYGALVLLVGSALYLSGLRLNLISPGMVSPFSHVIDAEEFGSAATQMLKDTPALSDISFTAVGNAAQQGGLSGSIMAKISKLFYGLPEGTVHSLLQWFTKWGIGTIKVIAYFFAYSGAFLAGVFASIGAKSWSASYIEKRAEEEKEKEKEKNVQPKPTS